MPALNKSVVAFAMIGCLATGLLSACIAIRSPQSSGVCEAPCEPGIVGEVEEPMPEYVEGTPYWVPMIDRCMNNGGGRIECIENLPPDVLADFERWEKARGEERRALFNTRSGGFGVQNSR